MPHENATDCPVKLLPDPADKNTVTVTVTVDEFIALSNARIDRMIAYIDTMGAKYVHHSE